jgi:colanic acid/amylovoran biosynthesis glycosyltransferase
MYTRNTPVTLAYLTNRYPAVSHTFIRREIAALEALGATVERISLQRCEEGLPDPADREEALKTEVVLDRGSVGLLLAGLGRMLRSPLRAMRAVLLAIRLGSNSERGIVVHLAYLLEGLALLAWCRARAIDHVHAHFGTNPAMVALLCRELGGPSYSFTVHGFEPFAKAEWIRLPEKIERAEFVAGVCDFGVAQLRRHCGPEDREKVHCIRCGLDAARLPAITPVPDAQRLVFVGRLCAEKDPGSLLRALASLASKFDDLTVTFVGDGPLRAELRAEAEDLGVSTRVEWRGSCSHEEVLAAIRAARALVLPSVAEGLPVVLMEAFAVGRPVVSTFVGGIPELVQPGASGWLVPAGSAQALEQALREVLEESTGRLGEMAAAGRAQVVARHDVATEAVKLMSLFRRHAGSRHRR